MRDFLSRLPAHRRAAFEFRHQTWFDDEVFTLLHDHEAALCIADADDDLKVPFVATGEWGYLRLRRSGYEEAQLKKWAQRVHGQDWSEVFVFFKHESEGKGPQLAQRFMELAL